MKKGLTKLLGFMLITAMVLSVAPAFNMMLAKAQPPAPSFYILPASQSFTTSAPAAPFTETLSVSTSGDTFTYQYEVDFDPAQLQCSSAAYTSVATSDFFKGHTTVPTGPTIDNVTGKISGGETLLGSDVVHATSGANIITMTFVIVGSPPINGKLTSLITANNPNTFLLDPDLNTVAGVSYGDCTFTYTWAAPPPPQLTVAPQTQSFDQFHQWNGSTFTEDVVVKNTAGWFLGNATIKLDYNSALTSVTNIAFDPIWGTTASSDTGPGTLQFDVSGPTSVPVGDVKIATVTFTIIGQGSVPPRPFGSSDVSTLHFHDFQLGSTAGFFIQDVTAVDGTVTVFAYAPISPPHLAVSSATLDSTNSTELFNITVSFVGVSDFQNIIGIQFRLGYDNAVLQPTAVYEGPFLNSFAVQQPGPKLNGQTFFISYIEDPDGVFGPSVLVGNLIFPNSTGQWNPPMLSGTGDIAYITFRLLLRVPTVAPLNIVDQQAVALDNLVSQNVKDTALSDPVNGTVTVTVNLPGRAIDLFGGAVNSGFATLVGAPYLQFPAPYGGQGSNVPMDLVEPESWVYLNANITYNFFPVQEKSVAFEIDEPDGTEYTKLIAVTDQNGIASVGFRMPWPSGNPESLLGVWKAIATVQLADITINDTMSYEYNYLVQITKVTTDKFEYNHGDTVSVEVFYKSYAQQMYPGLFVASIVDELGVTVGHYLLVQQIGGAAQFNVPATPSFAATITLPSWAFAGTASVKVDCFSTAPAQGGVALTPEFVGRTILIQPA
jgi:hypothetical protein